MQHTNDIHVNNPQYTQYMSSLYKYTSSYLYEGGLALARFTGVSFEAFAKSRTVIADSASGAVAAFESAHGGIAGDDGIGVGRALDERAIRTTEAVIAPASHLIVGIPVQGVGSKPARRGDNGIGIVRDLLFADADTVAGAIIGAHRTFARGTGVVVEALALPGLAITESTIGAFHNTLVGQVGSPWGIGPGGGTGAGTKAAVSTGPRVMAFAVGWVGALGRSIPSS